MTQYPEIHFWDSYKEICVTINGELDILITAKGIKVEAEFDGHYGAYHFYHQLDTCDIVGWLLLWKEVYGQEV